ncbi:unnamed protein product [Musa acuminata subsp. malaccensis]|nr:unnamed protein product [Musa acuminata subsp. malaccensis]
MRQKAFASTRGIAGANELAGLVVSVIWRGWLVSIEEHRAASKKRRDVTSLIR